MQFPSIPFSSIPLSSLPLSSLRCAVICCLLMTSSAVRAQQDSEASPSNWVNPQGKAIAAEFLRLEEDGVVLRIKSTGKEVKVAFSSLSLESHLQALKLADPEAFSKPLAKAPVKLVIEDAPLEATFGANELMISPFSGGASLEQFLDTTKSEIQRGNLFIAWHGVPPKLQNDVEDLMVKGVSTMGSTAIVQIRNILKSLNNIVHEKRDFILGYPALAAQPQLVAQLQEDWPKYAAFSTMLSDETKWQKENFEKGKILPWLAGLNADLAPYILSMAEEVETASGGAVSPLKLEYKILSQSADRAKVQFSSPGQPPRDEDFQKVGDIWLIPGSMNELKRNVDEASKKLGSNTDPTAMIITGLMGTVAAAVGSIERAQTQEEFNKAVDEILGLFQGMSSGLQPGGAMAGGGARSPMAPAGPTSTGAAPGQPRSRTPSSVGAGT